MLDPMKTKNKQLVTNQTTATGTGIIQTVRCLTCREVLEERTNGVVIKTRACRCPREAK